MTTTTFLMTGYEWTFVASEVTAYAVFESEFLSFVHLITPFSMPISRGHKLRSSDVLTDVV